ncbi:DUF5688 family protein [Eubacterium sp.]
MEQIMDIKEFQKKLVETINEKTENAVIEAKEVIGNNGVKRHGLVMKGITQYTNPVIYIDKEYERYSDEEEIDDIYDISQRIIQIYELSKNEDIGQEEMVKNINDWNWAKNKVMFTLVNTDKNKEMLKAVPSTPFLDLSYTYYIQLQNGNFENGNVRIKNEYLDRWDITLEELHKQAVKNLMKFTEEEMEPMVDVVLKILFEGNDEFKEEGTKFIREVNSESEYSEMHVLSTTSHIYGAVYMFYSSKIKALADKLDSDLYILPSSIHELILIPVLENEEVETLREMVNQVNEESVENIDYLSDNVYRFNRNTEEICIA